MTKEICKFFICLVNVLVVRILFFDLKLTCDEHGVDFSCNLFAPRFVLSGASNVVNVDVRTELFGCFWVLGFRGSGEGLHCSSCYIGCRLVSKVKTLPTDSLRAVHCRVFCTETCGILDHPGGSLLD